MGFRNAEWRAVVLDGTAGPRSTGKPVSAQSHYKAHRVALTAAAPFNSAPDTGECGGLRASSNQRGERLALGLIGLFGFLVWSVGVGILFLLRAPTRPNSIIELSDAAASRCKRKQPWGPVGFAAPKSTCSEGPRTVPADIDGRRRVSAVRLLGGCLRAEGSAGLEVVLAAEDIRTTCALAGMTIRCSPCGYFTTCLDRHRRSPRSSRRPVGRNLQAQKRPGDPASRYPCDGRQASVRSRPVVWQDHHRSRACETRTNLDLDGPTFFSLWWCLWMRLALRQLAETQCVRSL